MTFQGKGMFIWKIPRCEQGDPAKIAQVAQNANFTHVLVKIADGTLVYHGDWGSTVDMVSPVINALRTASIKVVGWHYLYGDNPAGEARIAIQRIKQLKVDAYVIDVEGQYKAPGKREAAKRFMSDLRAALPTLTVALSSYRYPTLHPQIPWKEFLEKCDFNMPQVYWMKAHNPAAQLQRCLREFQSISPFRTLVPTGAAFREHGWQPTDREVLEFLNKVKELNLHAANFWEWSEARSGIMPNVWETIRDFNWDGSPAVQDICQQFVAALNKRDPNLMASLYTPNAVHITAARTVQGIESIRTWYASLFNQVLPNAAFTLTSYTGKGSSRRFTWSADSPSAVVLNGGDTLGLLNDKIAYHFTSFAVSPK